MIEERDGRQRRPPAAKVGARLPPRVERSGVARGKGGGCTLGLYRDICRDQSEPLLSTQYSTNGVFELHYRIWGYRCSKVLKWNNHFKLYKFIKNFLYISNSDYTYTINYILNITILLVFIKTMVWWIYCCNKDNSCIQFKLHAMSVIVFIYCN